MASTSSNSQWVQSFKDSNNKFKKLFKRQNIKLKQHLLKDLTHYIFTNGIIYFSQVKQIFRTGDKKYYEHTVTKDDFASFHGKTVHEVYSTFCLTRDAEWSSRLFVLEMKEEDEEGIGTFVHIEHIAPAFENDTVLFIASLLDVKNNEVVCSIEARVGNRLIGKGKTGQKIIKKEKIKKYFTLVRQENETS